MTKLMRAVAAFGPDRVGTAPTTRQVETLRFIAEHGSPTVREIGARFGIQVNAVDDRLTGLERRGLISRPVPSRFAKTRTITITTAGWDLLGAHRCPSCGSRNVRTVPEKPAASGRGETKGQGTGQ